MIARQRLSPAFHCYEGRGQLLQNGLVVATVTYRLEVWTGMDGQKTLLGMVQGPSYLLTTGTTFVLRLRKGVTLNCTLQAMPDPGWYEVLPVGPLPPIR
ncbi:MAG: hypothetical protein DIU80_014150 [Chloroflexota bacterium]|nr:MAG: hypothetical protein DIU80_07610 [Chloroflexota bacterium]